VKKEIIRQGIKLTYCPEYKGYVNLEQWEQNPRPSGRPVVWRFKQTNRKQKRFHKKVRNGRINRK